MLTAEFLSAQDVIVSSGRRGPAETFSDMEQTRKPKGFRLVAINPLSPDNIPSNAYFCYGDNPYEFGKEALSLFEAGKINVAIFSPSDEMYPREASELFDLVKWNLDFSVMFNPEKYPKMYSGIQNHFQAAVIKAARGSSLSLSTEGLNEISEIISEVPINIIEQIRGGMRKRLTWFSTGSAVDSTEKIGPEYAFGLDHPIVHVDMFFNQNHPDPENYFHVTGSWGDFGTPFLDDADVRVSDNEHGGIVIEGFNKDVVPMYIPPPNSIVIVTTGKFDYPNRGGEVKAACVHSYCFSSIRQHLAKHDPRAAEMIKGKKKYCRLLFGLNYEGYAPDNHPI